jgi:hypothetical protein
MGHTTHWFAAMLVLIAAILGFLIRAEGLPDTIRKYLIIGSFFGMLGLCLNPIED